MNAFLAVINLNAPAVQSRVLAEMSKELDARGCVHQESWTEGEAGFGIGWFEDRKPDSKVHGEITVVGDIRLDARDELIAELGVASDTNDARIVADAYRKWGAKCVERFIGDFAFLVYDREDSRILCARDHFGVKPIFYAVAQSSLIVSNTIEAVIAHPEITDDVNDLAIADFLLFDHIQDPTITAYCDVLRLPPAHVLHFGRGGLKVERYWTLPSDCETRFRRRTEYVERYIELLGLAVRDRLHDQQRVSVLMSGGLDSTSVAAIVKEQGKELAAFTLISEANGPDPERPYSRLAAEGIGIPITQHHQEKYEAFAGWETLPHRKPEPSIDLFPQSGSDFLRRIAGYGSVALSGYGGDPGLFPSAEFVRTSLRSWSAVGVLAESARYVLTHGKLPNVGLRTALRRRKDEDPGPLPDGLNPDFVKQYDLEQRWIEFNRLPNIPVTTRPEAYRILVSPGWEQLFWLQEAGFTGVPVEVRHPMFDLRVLKFLLGVPPIPWCVDKELLRIAMKGRLPDAIRHRPKTTAGSEVPIRDGINTARLLQYGMSGDCQKYVTSLPEGFLPSKDFRTWNALRPWLLNMWLNFSRIRKDVHFTR